jgi:hypothetical protein
VCPLCNPDQFPDGFFTVDVTLSASQFCDAELSDAVVSGSLVTVSDFQLNDFALNHVQGDGLAVADQSLFFQVRSITRSLLLCQPLHAFSFTFATNHSLFIPSFPFLILPYLTLPYLAIP